MSDFAVLIVSMMGVIIPIFATGKLSLSGTWVNGAIIIACLFVISSLGAFLVHSLYNLDISASITRIFLTSSVSHIIFIMGKMEAMYRIDLKRRELEHE